MFGMIAIARCRAFTRIWSLRIVSIVRHEIQLIHRDLLNEYISSYYACKCVFPSWCTSLQYNTGLLITHTVKCLHLIGMPTYIILLSHIVDPRFRPLQSKRATSLLDFTKEIQTWPINAIMPSEFFDRMYCKSIVPIYILHLASSNESAYMILYAIS